MQSMSLPHFSRLAMIRYAKWSNSHRKLERLGRAWLLEGVYNPISLCCLSLPFLFKSNVLFLLKLVQASLKNGSIVKDSNFPAKSHFSGTCWKTLLFAGNPSLWKTTCSFLVAEQVLIPQGQFTVGAKPAQRQVQKPREATGKDGTDLKTKIFGCSSVCLCLGNDS